MLFLTTECTRSRISSTTQGRPLLSISVRALILASNMISGDGLELLIDDLMKNTTLKHLDVRNL